MYLFIHCFNQYLRDGYPEPWSCIISFAPPFYVQFIVTLNLTHDSTWPDLTKKYISFTAFNIICISGSRTSRLWQLKQTMVCFILTYHVCASAETITTAHLLILTISNNRLLLIPYSISLIILLPNTDIWGLFSLLFHIHHYNYYE